MWYKCQPLVCDICNDNHKAADCPLKGKCKRCREAAHFVRNCPKPVWYVPGRPETDADSDDGDNVDGNDHDNVNNNENDNDNDVNGGAATDDVAVPVVSGAVESAVDSVPFSLVAPAPGVDVVSGGGGGG